MRIGTTETPARSCVNGAKFFIVAILFFTIVERTRQEQPRDVKSKWDTRLLPTNSVYEKSQNSASTSSLNENNVMENSKAAEDEPTSYDDSEEVYDDDYELEDTSGDEEVTKSVSVASPIPSGTIEHEVRAKSEESRAENSRDASASREDDDYYYWNDYDNATNHRKEVSEHETDHFRSSEDPEPTSSSERHEKSSESSSGENDSAEADPSMDESSRSSGPSEKSSPIGERSSDDSSEEESGDELSNEPSDEEILRQKSTELNDDEILIGEAVVSVVTTKSVVNGTISVPSSSRPTAREQITSPIVPNSTPDPGIASTAETMEDSRIVASVQTSRSISGARFLPFHVVESLDGNSFGKTTENSSDASGSDESGESKTKSKEEEEEEEEEKMETPPSTTTKKLAATVESTESIIDKLDRVQSELSSGFLANGFRTSGNNLQIDALGEQRSPAQGRKSFTTTSRTPVISKFVPRRYNQEKKPTVVPTLARVTLSSLLDDDNNGSTEKAKFRWPSSSRNARPSSTESSHARYNNVHRNNNLHGFAFTNAQVRATTTPSTSAGLGGNHDISDFLPPGYKLKKEDDQVTEKSLLSEILAKSKFDISSFLPANYNAARVEEKHRDGNDDETRKAKEVMSDDENLSAAFGKSTLAYATNAAQLSKNERNEDGSRLTGAAEKSSKPGKSLQDLFAKTSVDITALLPPDYNKFKSHGDVEKSTTSAEKARESSTMRVATATTARSVGGIKLVFPSRPGGRKALTKATATTQRAEGSGPVTPRIQKGWPTRATTEFTGWPTPSTTPISIEKLLEAARTATVPSINVSMVTMTEASSTTSTSTTTTTTPRPTTPGICEDECEVAGTIRIIGNATWVPELLDRNTREWQQLAEEIENEMNLVFVKSSVLKQWYKRIRIDAFSPGSILVDYFIELADLTQRINTQELKVIFHDSLRTYHSDVWNETRAKGPVRLGAFALDPKSTDFVVIPKVAHPPKIQDDDRLIPQWAIAVIVIGVGGLLFIIVFGVSVLVNRQNASKLRPNSVVFTEDVAKNIIQASHAAPSHGSSHDYPKSEISTIWNDTELWRDKSFESNSNEVLVDGTLGRERNADRRHGERKYSMYDSWRSEWNGYYYNPSQSSKFAGYESTTNLSRHPPDYDTNF